MNGVKMNFNKYWKTVSSMRGPIMPSELPEVKLDISGMFAYARSVGRKPSELSEKEKRMFIEGDYSDFYQANLQNCKQPEQIG